MAETVVKLRLNQAATRIDGSHHRARRGADRVALVRPALREYAAAHKAEASR